MRGDERPPSSADTATASRRVAPPRSPIKKRASESFLVLRSRRVNRSSLTASELIPMATITLPRPIAPHRSSSPRPPLTHSINLESINSSTTCPIPIPNKHLPVCPPGPTPAEKPDTPPASPPNKHAEFCIKSLLHPPTKYYKYDTKPRVYGIGAQDLAAAIDHHSTQVLPDPEQLFPWLHGLHPLNQVQQSFFNARKRSLKRTPNCFRGIMVVKADGDLSNKRLKGAIAPQEILVKGKGEFKEVDPRDGFSVRNFQIQAAKIAPLCDIVVYGEDEQECKKVATACAQAQRGFRELNEKLGHEIPLYNTFIWKSEFVEFEVSARHLVVVDSKGQTTGEIMDFFHQERVEMATMTKASEIGRNVWLGPTPDQNIQGSDDQEYDLYLECSDAGQLNLKALFEIAQNFEKDEAQKIYLEIPSSGSVMPPTWSMDEANAIKEICRYVYHMANGIPLGPEEGKDHEGDSPMPDRAVIPRRVLFHCADGYTESTMFAIAYYIYATGFTLSKAIVSLHTEKSRNFFAYPSDMALLRALTPILLAASPALHNSTQAVVEAVQNEKKWLEKMDGSLPSRITDCMYLGNLGHVNNPELLAELGIGQILSVGETATWTEEETEAWTGKVMTVCGVQDNGIDPLTGEFERCLGFIDQGRTNRTATLVHCRVGVSRSATICIAEVMRSMKLSYPRAYCYVRARRLNVIIQPHLRFSYELLKWEEALQLERGEPVRREREWAEVAREIAAMNRPYSS